MTWDELRGVRWSTRILDRRAAARDLWPGSTLDWWQGRAPELPDAVVWPADEGEVSRALRAAARRRVPVVPYGGGSGVCGGAAGRAGGLTMDLKALDRVGPLDEARWTVDVEAGVNGQILEDWLAERGYTLGHSPSSIWCSTVGGWAAARSAGQFSSRYGSFEDMVLALRVVSPARGAFTVGEGGDAPDGWMPLLLGSEGTLGVITRARLRVWPAPARRWLRGYRFPDVASALDAMRRVMQGELWPAVLRLYDPVDTRVGGRTRPKRERGDRAFYRDWLAAVDRLPAWRRRSLALPLSLPGLVRRVADGVAADCLVVAGWEGDGEVVDALAAAGHAILGERGEDLGEGPGERWYRARHDVSYKLMPFFERGGFADTMEVACRWSQVEDMYRAIRDAASRTAVVMAHMSHAWPEGCCIYFSFAGRGDARVYQRTWSAALAAALAVGGTVTHHHGGGQLKAEAASHEAGPALAGWRELKRELDPDGALNPGRLFADVPPADPGPPRALAAADGLARGPIRAGLSERMAAGEPLWPWERVEGPPRWQRLPWQTTWLEVAGRVDGHRCVLGRAPRSAAGSDLRGWLAARDPDATATWALAPDGPRWMGELATDRPAEAALALLRADLRPAALALAPGRLRVGFRGPAAAELGALAARRAPGLAPVPWRVEPMPSADLVPCDAAAPEAVAVTHQGALRRRDP